MSQFIVRSPPQPGESLSSWRHRFSCRNGYAASPPINGKKWKTDPDRTPDLAGVLWVSQTHGVAPEQVRAASLTSLGYLGPSMDALRVHPRWLLRVRYSRRDRPTGPVYCAECLRTDTTPFFRIAWRNALITECIVHGVGLSDRCPSCGAGAWPHGADRRTLEITPHQRMDHCVYCQASLVAEIGEAIDASRSKSLSDICRAPTYQLSEDLEVPTWELLAALEALCHLFMRRRSRDAIATSSSPCSAFAREMSTGRCTNNAADLPLGLRRKLLQKTFPLLERWPNSFIEFAREAELTQKHFSGANHLHPAWMQDVVHTHLRKQNRGVTELEVAAAVKTLECAQGDVTKAAVRALLRSHSTLIDDLWTNRAQATEEELDIVIRWYESADKAKRSVRACRARDQVIFCIAVLGHLSMSEVSEFSTGQIESMVVNFTRRPPMVESPLGRSLACAWTTYKDLTYSTDCVADETQPLFRLKPGTPVRSAQARLRRAMANLDSRLLRKVEVFWKIASSEPEVLRESP